MKVTHRQKYSSPDEEKAAKGCSFCPIRRYGHRKCPPEGCWMDWRRGFFEAEMAGKTEVPFGATFTP